MQQIASSLGTLGAVGLASALVGCTATTTIVPAWLDEGERAITAPEQVRLGAAEVGDLAPAVVGNEPRVAEYSQSGKASKKGDGADDAADADEADADAADDDEVQDDSGDEAADDEGDVDADAKQKKEKAERPALGILVGVAAPRWEQGVAVSLEPRDWLELDLGLWFGMDQLRSEVDGESAEADAFAFTYPLRAKFWLMGQGHSVIADVGVGFVMSSIDAAWYADDQGVAYDRQGIGPMGQLGIGYGYKSIGPIRIELLFGVKAYAPGLDRDVQALEPLNAGNEARVNELDDEVKKYLGIRPFGELSVGAFY